MNKPINIKEFKALVKRYETITIKEIKNCFEKDLYWNPAKHLTGFGNRITCILCDIGNKNCDCEICVYQQPTGCSHGKNRTTYLRILTAHTARKLFNAYKARAKHLRLEYSQYL